MRKTTCHTDEARRSLQLARGVILVYMQTKQQHWEDIYSRKNSSEVSWYQHELEVSLNFIINHSSKDAKIIDIGAGGSNLVAFF